MQNNMIGNYNDQQGGPNPQGQQPGMGLQGLVSMPNSSSPSPVGISIPIRVDDGQRNCVVYLNFPPMNIMEIHQLVGQLKAIGLQVADRKNFDDNQNYNKGGYNQGGYNPGGYNRGGYNNNRGGY